jgi:ketosteroid isomerase-like protein
MSEENVELVRRSVDAWNRGDYAAASESVAPEIEVEDNLGGDLGGTHEGIAGFQRYLARFWSSFADFHTEIDECIAAGAEVAFLAHHYGRGRGSGVEVEMRNWHVVTVRGGKFVRYRMFRTKAEALEAAGLRE